jgi:spermidine/putrescine transport system substrate-binding protein
MTVRWSKTGLLGRSRPYHLSRRRFLQFSTAAVSSFALANCRKPESNNSDAGSGASTDGNNKPLHIYTWADYVDDEVYDRFTQATGIPIEVQTYDSNEVMLAKIQAGGGQQFSILYPSDYMVQQMIELGLLATLDHAQLTGLDDLRRPWQNPTYDPTTPTAFRSAGAPLG